MNYKSPIIRRYDFVSSVIEVSLKRITPDGLYQQREKFIKSVNAVWQKTGVLDMMKEKPELQWVLEQLKIQYYSASAAYGGEYNKNLTQFGKAPLKIFTETFA